MLVILSFEPLKTVHYWVRYMRFKFWCRNLFRSIRVCLCVNWWNVDWFLMYYERSTCSCVQFKKLRKKFLMILWSYCSCRVWFAEEDEETFRPRFQNRCLRMMELLGHASKTVAIGHVRAALIGCMQSHAARQRPPLKRQAVRISSMHFPYASLYYSPCYEPCSFMFFFSL